MVKIQYELEDVDAERLDFLCARETFPPSRALWTKVCVLKELNEMERSIDVEICKHLDASEAANAMKSNEEESSDAE